MTTTSTETSAEGIADHETARCLEGIGETARRLQIRGFTPGESANLTARLAGLPIVRSGWAIRQVEHLVFLRSIVESGRLRA